MPCPRQIGPLTTLTLLKSLRVGPSQRFGPFRRHCHSRRRRERTLLGLVVEVFSGSHLQQRPSYPSLRRFHTSTTKRNITMSPPTIEIAVAGKKIPVPTGIFIDNQFIPGRGQKITTINPATEEVIATVDGVCVFSSSVEMSDTAPR